MIVYQLKGVCHVFLLPLSWQEHATLYLCQWDDEMCKLCTRPKCRAGFLLHKHTETTYCKCSTEKQHILIL